MFRQRLRLPHHLTFGVLPRISGRPQWPSCSRSRTRFPGDRRTLLPLGSALTLLVVLNLLPFFPPSSLLTGVFSRDEYYPGSSSSRRSSEFKDTLIPPQPSSSLAFSPCFVYLRLFPLRRILLSNYAPRK